MSNAEHSIAPAIRSTRVEINTLFEHCRSANYSIALWRKPGGPMIGIIDTGTTEIEEIELETSTPGFLFHPYDAANEIHFLKAELRFEIREGNAVFDDDSDKPVKRKILSQMDPIRNGRFSVSKPEHNEDARHSYMNLVQSAIQKIQEGKFQKIVPSRFSKLEIRNLNLASVFESMCIAYPNAFVSATYVPAAGLWIGASPEILVKTNYKTFTTVSLAGTQPYSGDIPLHEIAWTQKEIEEQALVSRYIINCFKKIRLREFDEIGPKTVIAGNLIHLKTTYKVDMEAVNFPQLGTVMMQLLHPTSAVCGMPLDEAKKWLQANEGYDREYFTGYLGPVNSDSETDLYVNLRCMKIRNEHAWIYAGAGVTEDSRPDKETRETEYKMQTLLDVIN